MLALARKVGQTIIIGDDIKLTVIAINKDQVKIGIDAPKSVPIYREELFAEVEQENKAANTGSLEKLNKLKDLMK